MTKRPWQLPLLLLICLSPSLTHAQQYEDDEAGAPAELVTDRPDATESSTTVPQWRLQLEAGVQYTHDDFVDLPQPTEHSGNYDANRVSAPNLLLRFGVADFAEVRLGVPDVAFEHITGGESDVVFGAVSLGAKLAGALTDDVRIGMIPYVDLQTESGDVGGGVIATTAVDLTGDIGLAINAGITSQLDVLDERHYDGLITASLGFALSDRLSAFVEAYTVIPEGDADYFVDLGATYLLADELQLDFYMGTHVPEANQIFMGSGISVLF